ncbi:glycosyl transferase family protein [Mycobacteroides abscessus subsp. abscessus]|nr:glycosyl transferase family protein [Mycobacteroides abscessus subsp. abscessus]
MEKTEIRICLCMIVKNESKIIERCLESAKSIIDYVSICDTGSTDQTPELIQSWCEKSGIPGTVHFEQFKNFGYNRSLAVSLAKKTYPEANYLLLLDADMILQVDSLFDKNSLCYDQYLTPQHTGQLKFWLTRLIKTSLPWKSVGVTHEYWDVDRSNLEGSYLDTRGRLDSLIIDDQGDGGSRSDKFERDKKLLLEGVMDPSTPSYLIPRYMFYLAQTYMCLGEYEESINWYKNRVAVGGWVEEIFYSLLQIGICYEDLANQNSSENEQKKESSLQLEEEQNLALAIHYFQKAWEYRPSRAEPLYHLARIHRSKGNYNLGMLYARQGQNIPFPSEDILFVDFHVYDYLFDYELSICSYYVENEYEVGRDAQNKLTSKINSLPQDIAEVVKQNAKFYK